MPPMSAATHRSSVAKSIDESPSKGEYVVNIFFNPPRLTWGRASNKSQRTRGLREAVLVGEVVKQFESGMHLFV